jgi:methyl-accepting chemotaxis protein
MDHPGASRSTLNTQMNVWMILSLLAPLAAIFGLGAWVIFQLTPNSETSPQDLTMSLWIATLAAALGAVVIVAFAWIRMRAALRLRMLELAEVLRRVAAGDRLARAPQIGRDELAILSASVNAMLDGAPLPTFGRPSSGLPREAVQLQQQIEKLLTEVSAVGDGDLRVQAEVTPDTLGVLADSFNYMIEELAKVVGRVQATALQVTNATRRLLDRSAEVAGATDAQALQINQTSDAVASLAEFVQLSANNALTAVEAAREALGAAQSGKQAVVESIEGMGHIRDNVQDTAKKIKRLGERSQEVGEMVRLIEDIADQTNLLALNAAIQSAMGGEHGRGFTQVADEIRALAERVTEATKRISTLVKGIQGDTYDAVVAMEESTKEVVRGSKLADDAGNALQTIYGSVERQSQIVEGIATAAGERKRTAEAVAQSMSQIADIARQTNAATQDASSSVSYLADLAEQLRASVATFRLPERIAEQAGLAPQSAPLFATPAQAAQLGSGRSGAGWEVAADDLRALPAADALIGARAPSGGFGATSQPGDFSFGAYGETFNGDGYGNGYGDGYGAPAGAGAPGAPGEYPDRAEQGYPWPPAGEAPYPPDQFEGRS